MILIPSKSNNAFKLRMLFCVFFCLFDQVYSQENKLEKYTDFVDPFIGTSGHGHTFPGACLPFGMIQLSPDNEKQGWDWCSGYHASDNVLVGFSHTHLSGTGCADMQDVLFMPTTNDIVSDSTNNGRNFIYHYKTSFSHNNEKASPGYYSVKMDNSIIAELTASFRAGFHKYTFPKDSKSKIIIDLNSRASNRMVETYIRVVNDSTIEGYTFTNGWAAYRKVYFAAKFSKPFYKFYTSANGLLNEGQIENKGKSAKAILCFNTENDPVIYSKVGISSSGIEGAIRNLNAEIPTWNFKSTVQKAQSIWNSELAKFKIKTCHTDKKIQFYTALYHNMIAPNIYSDTDGAYLGMDNKIHKAIGFDNYYTLSLWDTFRATNPLYTLTDEKKVSDFVNSMLTQYKESGLLPVWSLWGNETNCMIGYHAVPVIVDAYLKGIKGFDTDLAYEAILKSSMQNIRQTDLYRLYSYIPSDLHKKQAYGWDQSVSTTLEYAYDDWCIAQMAKKLNKNADFSNYLKRSQYYKNLADTSIGFMRRKNSDGKWDTPFNPAKLGDGFTEGNSWQYSWFVPHDVKELIKIMGGKEMFSLKLDSLFYIAKQNTVSEIMDVSGFIGQYAQGNEPSHHVGYLYNYVGQSWKTQKTLALIRDSLYKSGRDGLCGNDDCGQMSAWYVFSCLGFYPVNPCDGNYIIGTPLFEKATIEVGKGKKFVVEARNISSKNIYIHSAKLNGRSLEKCSITHSDIKKGGVLIFEMSNKPNINLWNSNKSISFLK